MKPITEEVMAHARWLRERGHSWESVAATIGVHRQALARTMKRGRSKRTEVLWLRKSVLRRRKKGESWAEIAEAEGVTKAQARHAAAVKP